MSLPSLSLRSLCSISINQNCGIEEIYRRSSPWRFLRVYVSALVSLQHALKVAPYLRLVSLDQRLLFPSLGMPLLLEAQIQTHLVAEIEDQHLDPLLL